MSSSSKINLWLRWVGANAVGEMVGLGSTLAVGAYLITRLGSQNTVASILAAFGIAVISGVIEATLVGLLQWAVLSPWFPGITRRAWWLATLVGALIAYVLGYLPSTLMSFGEAQGAAPAAEPEQWVVLLLAAGMGLVGGAVLSFAQWRVLRGRAPSAGWWLPANMLAWTAGMSVIFWGIDTATKGQPMWQSVLIMVLALLLAGAVVGAVHGAALVYLAGKKQLELKKAAA